MDDGGGMMTTFLTTARSTLLTFERLFAIYRLQRWNAVIFSRFLAHL